MTQNATSVTEMVMVINRADLNNNVSKDGSSGWPTTSIFNQPMAHKEKGCTLSQDAK